MKKRLIIECFIVFAHVTLSAQTVQFLSAEFEEGVKCHLGLTDEDNITSNQLDTITQLNLSRFGLTDIRDVRLIPNLRIIDLSHNMISNVEALAKLDSLRFVDLSYNQLNNINMLAFSYSDKMNVDVSFNKISDFSLFDALTDCLFTIEGAGLQNWEGYPAFHVRYFYSDGISRKPTVYYRIESQAANNVHMAVQGSTIPVLSDDEPHICQLNSNYNGISVVTVSNGELSDSTYLVAPKTIHVNPLEIVTIETGLPDGYEIRYSAAKHGELRSDGSNLIFSAASDFYREEIIYTFYRGGVLKGVSKVLFTKEDMTIVDVCNLINYILGNQGDLHLENADVDGDGDVDYDDVTTLVKTILLKKQ